MTSTRWVALTLAASIGAGLAAVPAQASRTGKRNTALLLGGVAAYGVVKKNPTIAGLGTAGALYSYTSSLKHKKRHRRRARRVVYVPARRYRVYESGRSVPPGWSHGRKTGWGGRDLPPGLAKKY